MTDARRILPEATVYVYDNNSSDASVRLAQEAGAIVRHEYVQGKGAVIRRMFREIEAECYIMVDADDTYPMENAPEMVRLVEEHNSDMVVGDRLSSTYFTENKRPFHNFGNSIVRGTINRLFDCDVKDIMTGFRAFSYNFVKTFPVLSRGFEIETEMTIHAVYNHMQIDNVIVDYRDRPEGSESKLNTYSDGIRVLFTILKLYKDYKPMSFFSLQALVLTLISTAFLIPVLVEYVQTGQVARFPTLIVCCFVYMAAIQSVFSGMILSNLALANRREFEFNLTTLKARESRSE